MVQKEATFNIANESNLSNMEVIAGSMTYTADTNNIYFDIDTENNTVERIKITDIIIINDDSSKLKDSETTPVKNPIENKLYIFTKSEDMLIYHVNTNNKGKWIFVSSYNNKFYTINQTFKDKNGYDNDIFIENASIGSLIIDSDGNIGIITSKNINTNKVEIQLIIDVALREAFMIKGTFTNVEEITTNIDSYTTGSVLKYVGDNVINLYIRFSNKKLNTNRFNIINMTPLSNEIISINIEGKAVQYHKTQFALEDASYFVKGSNTVKNYYIEISYDNGGSNLSSLLKIDKVLKKSKKINNRYIDIIETLIPISQMYSNYTNLFNSDGTFDTEDLHNFICYCDTTLIIKPEDRILKLNSCWDKIFTSNDSSNNTNVSLTNNADGSVKLQVDNSYVNVPKQENISLIIDELKENIDTKLEIKKGFHHEIDTYVEHGFYLIELDTEYYQQNNLVIPLNFTPYYLLVVEKNGASVSFGNEKIVTQYMFDGNSIKSREKEDGNIQIGFDEIIMWTEWTEYATTTELESLQEKIDTKVEFRAIYRNELDDFVTLANVVLKVIGENKPEEGTVVVDPYWKDYYIIVQGTQIGNGEYSVSNFMTRADGIYVRTGVINIPMGTKTWSEWEKYVTKSEFDSKLANIKKNPNSTDGDLIATHLTVGTRKGNIGENSFVCGTYLQDASNEGNEASGFASVSIGGSNNVASSNYTAVIGGLENIASKAAAVVVGGAENVASNHYAAVVGGSINTANGLRSITLGGYGNTANDEDSITLGGGFNIALRHQVKAGFYAKDGVAGNGVDGDAFIIGNGSNNETRSNCFRVAYDGYVYGGKTFGADSADVAELYEWQDGNPNNEDRRGLFVTLDGTKIKLASPADTYIKGVISALPCLACDTYSDSWHGKYMKDIFGVPLKQMVHHEAEYKDGKLIREAYDSEEYIINPDYNSEQEYIPRKQRPEYDYVSNWGKLVLVDDGTCEVNGFATVGQGGKATKADKQTLYRVMERKDSTHIYVSIG